MKHSTDPMDMALSFQRGEREGFNHFFTELYPALLYYANRFLGDRVLAEDMVEESFIKIWKLHGDFKHHKVIKSWLYTTTKNACLNKLITEQRKHDRETAYYDYVKDDLENSPEENIIRAEVIAEVHKMLDILPRCCKQVITMYYFHGLNTTQIADQLGQSTCTVKNQKARGENLIKKSLGISIATNDSKLQRAIVIFKSEGTFTEIARKFNMSKSTVRGIKTGKIFGKELSKL